MKFSKPFLLKLIAFIEPNLFHEIYALNKKQKAERNFNKWCDFKIEIRQDLIKDIGDFSTIVLEIYFLDFKKKLIIKMSKKY